MTAWDPAARLAAKQHVDQLRSSKYGLDQRGRRVSAEQNPLTSDLSSAIKNLSSELYAKDTHFVLELIQNAEDNEYHAGVKPSLSFELLDIDPTLSEGADGALVIRNNEAGFKLDDVAALCSVGKSKKRKVGGFIGEKGIGFKSVFKVSRDPHIFSAGYSFRLPDDTLEVEAGLGYIVPYWIPEVPAWISSVETTIVLPLRPGKRQEIEKELQSFPPETILFLTKINKLHFRIGADSTLDLTKDDSRMPIVRLDCTVGSGTEDGAATSRVNEYFVESETFSRPHGLIEGRRVAVEESAVTVALPLTDGEKQKGGVFAYLPTDVKSGLPFILNADFLLTSGRSDVDRDCRWNHWLAGCVARTFVAAFDRMLKTPHRFDAYRFIPLAEEQGKHDHFFSAACADIVETLKSDRTVLVKGHPSRVTPSHSRRTSDQAAFRKLFAGGDRPSALAAIHLVDPGIETHRLQLAEIGVSIVSDADILACLGDSAWLRRRPLEWFADLYDFLHVRKLNEEELAALRALAVVPTKGRASQRPKVVRTDTEPVYLPIGEGQYRDLEDSCESLPVRIRFMDERLLQLILKRRSGKAVKDWLAEALGVYEFSPNNYAVDVSHYLRAGRDSLDAKLLVESTVLLARLIASCGESQEESILAGLPILLVDGSRTTPRQIKAEEKTLVYPEGLNPETGWQLIFSEPADRQHLAVLSDAYLLEDRRSEAGRPLLKLLAALGATDSPPPERINLKEGDQRLNKFEREAIEAHRHHSRYLQTIENSRPPRWLSSLTRLPVPPDLSPRGAATVRWLKTTLAEQRYGKAQWEEAAVNWFYYTWSEVRFESEFVSALRMAPWFETDKGFVTPREAFLDTPATRELLGQTVAFATLSLSGPVVRFLGVCEDATTDQILEVLGLRSRLGSCDRSFADRAYRLLQVSGGAALRERFAAERLIYLSHPKPRWWGSGELVWRDRSSVFGDLYGYLELEYPDLHAFFVDNLGIPDDVGLREYVTAWRRLPVAEDRDPRDIERALEIIYAAIGLYLQGRAINSLPAWWKDEWANLRVWTESRGFGEPGAVLLADDGDLKRVFGEAGDQYIWVPGSLPWARVVLLCQELGVGRLSRAVTSTAILPEGNALAQNDPVYLTPGAKFLILALIWNRDPAEYMTLQENGLVAELLRTSETSVERLEVRFTMRGLVRCEERLAFWSRSDATLLVRSEDAPHEGVRREVAENLARQLGHTRLREAEDQLFSMLCKSMGDARAMLAKRSWAVPPHWDSSVEHDALASHDSDVHGDGSAANGHREVGSPSRPPSQPLDTKAITAGQTSATQDSFESLTASSKTDPGPSSGSHDGWAHTEKPIPYRELAQAKFARPFKLAAAPQPPLSGSVPDPERRRLKIEGEIAEDRQSEPRPESRFDVVRRAVWEQKDNQVRLFLRAEYGGHCQICGETFAKRNGEPYFEGVYLISHTQARWVDRPGNVLCLCAGCSAKFQYGSVELEGFVERVLALQPVLGRDDRCELPFQLCGRERKLQFSQRHLMELQELMRAGEDEVD